MRFAPGAAFFLLLASAPMAAAQQAQPRALAVPATAAWQHASTEMILPPGAAGLTRTEIRDLGNDELDIVAGYESRDEGIWATVYLYKTQVPDVPLWYDRLVVTILSRPEYGLAADAAPAPAAFARPGASSASGLRAAFDVGTANVRSTAVAIAPLGPFQLKIRFSASRLDRAALDERLSRFIAALRWPQETIPPAPAAVPIALCPAALRLRNARVLRADMGNVLMDALGGIVTQDAPAGPPPIYCREPGPANAAYGVYRANASTDAYLIAVNDAGIAIAVGEAIDLSALMGERSGRRRFSMTVLGRNETAVLPSFNRLPPPAQAVAAAGAGGSTISVSTEPAGER